MRVTSKIYTFGSIFSCLFLAATVVSNFKRSETTRDRSKRDIKPKKIVANDFIPEAFFRERQHSGKTTTPSFSEDTLLHSFKCPETENDLVLVTTNARNPQYRKSCLLRALGSRMKFSFCTFFFRIILMGIIVFLTICPLCFIN